MPRGTWPVRRAWIRPRKPGSPARGHAELVHASDGMPPESARTLTLRRDSTSDGIPVCALAGWRIARRVPCVRQLHAHHRMLIGMGGTSRPDRDWLPRLITLCGAHHDWAHHQERRAAEHAGVIVRRGGYLAELDKIPVRYVLSRTGWAHLTRDGAAVPCPVPPGLPEGYA
jgi:hypothetical protein